MAGFHYNNLLQNVVGDWKLAARRKSFVIISDVNSFSPYHS